MDRNFQKLDNQYLHNIRGELLEIQQISSSRTMTLLGSWNHMFAPETTSYGLRPEKVNLPIMVGVYMPQNGHGYLRSY